MPLQIECVLIIFRTLHIQYYTKCALILLKEWNIYINYILYTVTLQQETACKLNQHIYVCSYNHTAANIKIQRLCLNEIFLQGVAKCLIIL